MLLAVGQQHKPVQYVQVIHPGDVGDLGGDHELLDRAFVGPEELQVLPLAAVEMHARPRAWIPARARRLVENSPVSVRIIIEHAVARHPAIEHAVIIPRPPPDRWRWDPKGAAPPGQGRRRREITQGGWSECQAGQPRRPRGTVDGSRRTRAARPDPWAQLLRF